MIRINYNGIITAKSKIPEYSVWKQIKDRCTNKNNKCYPRYGGRGITFCDRWSSFENFIEDMGYRPIGGDKMSIERIDNNGNYEPRNCIWATQKEQLKNTSRNRYVEFEGKRMTVSDWANLLGVTRQCINGRINKFGEQEAIRMGGNNSKLNNKKI